MALFAFLLPIIAAFFAGFLAFDHQSLAKKRVTVLAVVLLVLGESAFLFLPSDMMLLFLILTPFLSVLCYIVGSGLSPD
jgi:Na+/melibiose symporter-like transporter